MLKNITSGQALARGLQELDAEVFLLCTLADCITRLNAFNPVTLLPRP